MARASEPGPGRDGEEMFLSLAIKNPTQLVLGVLDRFLLNVEAHPERASRMRASIEAWKKEVVPGS